MKDDCRNVVSYTKRAGSLDNSMRCFGGCHGEVRCGVAELRFMSGLICEQVSRCDHTTSAAHCDRVRGRNELDRRANRTICRHYRNQYTNPTTHFHNSRCKCRITSLFIVPWAASPVQTSSPPFAASEYHACSCLLAHTILQVAYGNPFPSLLRRLQLFVKSHKRIAGLVLLDQEFDRP